jgi:Flp pilus assembly protein TadD
MSVNRNKKHKHKDRGTTPEAFYERANRFKIQGRIQEAVSNYDAALRLRPDFPEALCSSAILLQESGFCDAALRFYNQALRIRPDFPEALFNRGNVLQYLNRFEDALESYNEAIASRPEQAAFYINRGAAFYELGKLDEAIASYQTALRLDSSQPECALNLGNALMKAGQLEPALEAYNTALRLRPAYGRALCGKAIVLKEMSHFSEAMRYFDRALALEPDSNEVLSNRGCLDLLLGNFEKGWQGYERRWVFGERSPAQLTFTVPVWRGENIAQRHILVVNDHALGDIIQFSRFLVDVIERGAHVSFLCPAHMHKLIATVHPALHLVSTPDETIPYDVQIMLGSLAPVLNLHPETVPARTHYLQANPDLVAHWREKLGTQGFKIGINWQGNMNIRVDPQRSFPLDMFAPLAQIPGIRLISLQKGSGSEQLPEAAFPVEIYEDVDTGPDAFIDTAAIIENLDLVITCDTSVAHLAGALGARVWVALKHVPEWRWQMNRSDSPWYPTLELFRQQERGDWASVFRRMADRLNQSRINIRS